MANGKPAEAMPKFDALEDRYIDENRQLRVVVIGAGLAGILAGILLPHKVPNIDLHILEKNSATGGTWFENTYPGVRCDIPGDVYQASFTPRQDWTESFPTGPEVLQYWQELGQKHGADKYVRLNTRVEHVEWCTKDASWIIRSRNTISDKESEERADFVLTAIGRFNEWRMPSYPGMDSFQGPILHTANWPEKVELQGRRVAVIGNGSSGIQILPAILPEVEYIDHYARSPTWIAPSWAGDEDKGESQTDQSSESSESLTKSEEYLQYRKETEDKYWRRFDGYMRGTSYNAKIRDVCSDILHTRLQNKRDLAKHLVPSFSPNCRRLTPGKGYLEAIDQPNVNYIRDSIECFTKTGIRTVDGKEREIDVIICATGFNIDLAPPFPIEANGHDLKSAWAHDGELGYPYTYMGLAAPWFPNLMFLHGPHGTGLSGIVPHSCENQLTYICKVLRKIGREGIRSMVPTERATDDFQQYSDAFFARTVLSQECRSWYNGGRAGVKIHGLWPGSAAHATIVRKEPRWEDYEYEYCNSNNNRFWSYLGNGLTRKETDPKSDMTPYLSEAGPVDVKALHESWWSYP